MNYIEREACSILGTKDLEQLYTFNDFPVFMGCTRQTIENDLKADMKWVISRKSGLIQLKSLLHLDVLYPEAHGAGCIGRLWKQHHEAFSKFLLQYNLLSVFEIGGSHGILAKEYCDVKKIPWTIIEPNPSPIEGSEAKFIKGFFNDDFKFHEEFDAVVHSHLFEHIYEPNEFMRQLSNFIQDGKHLMFSIPNMQVMLERKYTNCINFEHTMFLTEPYVDYLLSKYGFKLLRKEYFKDDHSIFYASVKDSSVKETLLPSKLYQENKNLYLEYVKYHENLISELNDKIESTKKPVYLFGAHVFAQYLIAFGLKTDKIVCLLDNDPNKQGKRLYGTNLKVRSPKILKEIDKPIVILKAGVYNEEIKQDIINNINSTVEFWK